MRSLDSAHDLQVSSSLAIFLVEARKTCLIGLQRGNSQDFQEEFLEVTTPATSLATARPQAAIRVFLPLKGRGWELAFPNQ